MNRTKEQSIDFHIKNRISSHHRGWCMTSRHFGDLGSDGAIRIALHRLAKTRMIRRISTGIYEYPRAHPHLGTLPPVIDEVAKAISKKNHIRLQPSGAYAANLLGLSEQVPAKIVFLTDGPSKKMKVDNLEIVFKHTTTRNVRNAGTLLGLIIQAIKYLGKENMTNAVLFKLKKHIATLDEKNLKDTAYAPAWVRSLIMKLRQDSDE